MFWSIIVQPKKTTSIDTNQMIHLTNVCIFIKGKIENSTRTNVFVNSNNNKVLIATLIPGEVEQLKLDIVFSQGEIISISNEGNYPLHLSGYIVVDMTEATAAGIAEMEISNEDDDNGIEVGLGESNEGEEETNLDLHAIKNLNPINSPTITVSNWLETELEDNDAEELEYHPNDPIDYAQKVEEESGDKENIENNKKQEILDEKKIEEKQEIIKEEDDGLPKMEFVEKSSTSLSEQIKKMKKPKKLMESKPKKRLSKKRKGGNKK
ncbi:FK506-binding protein, putative [Entamoeba dispar SAW760]|uniref:FK506-binding protein, putative n=1 Tax=Entamoeba dispar (strain ATCC PRA-260 / SAW760) TaxID=370354 RepID=B0E9W8_ENTDS|nr:FK506-binding protein, putative [Entamoeba dispar SAW760]EDR28687.1 FK506-binding protein, putative [Entamoeba dispar SAW760]|eukprot:EDR28687.1 FK506-binding protein, putative [Entamoeba dispar SAW760]